MTGLSTYLEGKLLAWEGGTAMPTAPTSIYVGLFSADPTDAGVLTNEVTTTIRTAGRVAVTLGATTTGSGSTRANSAIVDFGNAAGAASVAFVATFDAATGGNMLRSAAVTGGTQSVLAGNAVNFPIGNLTLPTT